MFGQVLGELHYSNSTRRYVSPPIDERKQAAQKAEREYYSNLESTNKIHCEDLIAYATVNGKKIGSVSSLSLINSSWLKEVEAYNFEDNILVVATIKTETWQLQGKKYIFCGIPKENWEVFYNSYYDIGKTYGEKFHKYIIEYECDCK